MAGKRGRGTPTAKPLVRDVKPLRSETWAATRRSSAQTARERAAVEFDALRARMKDAPDSEWERVIRFLAGSARGG